MSLPTNQNLAGYQYKGGIYGNTTQKNNIIALNIKRNEQSNNDDKSTQLNGTEANLKLNDIYNNKIVNKSVKQKKNQNQIVYYDKINNNQYPVSDNFRNQLYLNDKNLNLINNINNNEINEINIHQNNNQQNYNEIQQNTENTLRNFNGIIDINNNSFPNNNIQKKISNENNCKCNCSKKCCIKWSKISGLIFMILLIIPIGCFLLYSMSKENRKYSKHPIHHPNRRRRYHSSDSDDCLCTFCCGIKRIIDKIKEIYNS